MKCRVLTLLIGVVSLYESATIRPTFAQTEAPSYQDGELWQFKVDISKYAAAGSFSNMLNGTYEVSFRGGELKTCEFNGSNCIDFVDGLQMLHAMFGKGNWHGGQFLNFPIAVGKTWKHQYRAPFLGLRQAINWTVEVSVVGLEKVNTPAGIIEAFRIRNSQLAGTSEGGARNTIDYHYSPATKSIVKLTFAGKTGSGSGGKADLDLLKFGLSEKR
jgi:hypothetical protein